jgi:hypothetical protein
MIVQKSDNHVNNYYSTITVRWYKNKFFSDVQSEFDNNTKKVLCYSTVPLSAFCKHFIQRICV